MTNHTPSPWTWHRLVDEAGVPMRGEALIGYVADCIRAGGDQDFYFVSAVKDDGRPADVCHAGNGPTSGANAEFIALACNTHDDLLEALKAQQSYEEHRLICAACREHWGDDCADAGDLFDRAGKLRRVAIAKTEGRATRQP